MNSSGNRGRQQVLLLVGVLALGTQTGCDNFTMKVKTNSEVRKEWKSNSRWSVSHSRNGITRKLNTSDDVEILNGRVTEFPKGALVKVEETGGQETRVAELRENGGALELWIKDGGDFRKGSPDDEVWLERCLTDLTGAADQKRTVEAALQDPLAPASRILATLDDTSFSSERAKILKELAAKPGLSSSEQSDVADAASKHLSFSSEKKDVLLELVRRPDFPPEANQAVMRAIDQLSFDSEKLEVQRALLDKIGK